MENRKNGTRTRSGHFSPPPVEKDSNKFHNDHCYFDEPRRFGGITLHQIGERYCRSGSGVGLHRHGDFFELTYAISGRACCRLGEDEFTVKENDLYLAFPHEEHDIVSDKAEPFRYFYMTFAFRPESGDRRYFEEASFRALRGEERVRRTPGFFSVFTELLTYADINSEYAREVMGLLVRLAVLRIPPLYGQVSHTDYLPPAVDEKKDLAYTVLRYIDTHLTDLDEMSEIADRLGYSYAHLSRVFHEKMGVTVRQYFSNRKLDLAHEQLSTGETSITEIAAKLHYSSVYAFSRAYKARFGESPRATRTKAKST